MPEDDARQMQYGYTTLEPKDVPPLENRPEMDKGAAEEQKEQEQEA